jgi:hypothetical protein
MMSACCEASLHVHYIVKSVKGVQSTMNIENVQGKERISGTKGVQK